MAKSLQEKEKLESYVSSDVLREARESVLASLQPGGEKIAATVAFVSLLPADKAAVKTGGAQLIASVNRFFNFSQVLCTENDGVIDKIIGHTLMMVFRAGSDRESHQLRACRVATRLVDSIKASELGSSCRVAAGLACGQLVSGKIGSRNGKLDFTVIGDTVNLAARLKSYAENLDGSVILLSDAMLPEISGEFAIRLESEVQLKGKSTQTSVYRVDL
ncbi:MAG: adenylate cyclase-like protein [uncultured bacterium]|nr:MAG: adenylate cyclase-like protein [uncultured bacterium]